MTIQAVDLLKEGKYIALFMKHDHQTLYSQVDRIGNGKIYKVLGESGKGLTKEPAIGFCAIGTYPLHYLLEIFKIAKKNKVSHMKIEMGRENRPIRLEFLSYDNLNLVNGSPKQVKTWAYLAPRIDTDYPDLTVAQLEERIKVHENEIVLLKNQLPKEAPKPL